MTFPPESLTVPTTVVPAVSDTIVSEKAIAALAGAPVKVTVAVLRTAPVLFEKVIVEVPAVPSLKIVNVSVTPNVAPPVEFKTADLVGVVEVPDASTLETRPGPLTVTVIDSSTVLNDEPTAILVSPAELAVVMNA
jgi:hypothetical protein